LINRFNILDNTKPVKKFMMIGGVKEPLKEEVKEGKQG
jgi:hypothetical protein